MFTLPKSCRDPLHAELPTLDEVSVPPVVSSISFLIVHLFLSGG